MPRESPPKDPISRTMPHASANTSRAEEINRRSGSIFWLTV